MQKDAECQCRHLPFSSEIAMTQTIEMEAAMPQVLCNGVFILFIYAFSPSISRSRICLAEDHKIYCFLISARAKRLIF